MIISEMFLVPLIIFVIGFGILALVLSLSQ